MLDTAARLLRLLSLLQTRPQAGGADLAGRLGVSTRTVRADVTRLRSLGYEIDAVPGVAGGYRLRAGSAVPPLLLGDDEALAVAVALRTAASSGLVDAGEHAASAADKLHRVLPARLRQRLDTFGAVASTAPNRRDPVSADTLAAVATACRATERLRFDYADRHGEPSRREVEPHRLVHVGGRWYLVGYDLARTDWRSFRVDRMQPKTPTGPRFTPRPPPEPDLATFVTRGRMAALWNYRATVEVRADAATVAARIPNGSWAVRPLDSWRSLLDAGAQNADLLAVYLGALDLDFRIDADAYPQLAAAAGKLAARYAATGG